MFKNYVNKSWQTNNKQTKIFIHRMRYTLKIIYLLNYIIDIMRVQPVHKTNILDRQSNTFMMASWNVTHQASGSRVGGFPPVAGMEVIMMASSFIPDTEEDQWFIDIMDQRG